MLTYISCAQWDAERYERHPTLENAKARMEVLLEQQGMRRWRVGINLWFVPEKDEDHETLECRGVSVDVHLLPHLIAALENARTIARRHGLLTPELEDQHAFITERRELGNRVP